MHVFIDTNILLNFFHYAKDELDSLNDVFASHEHGSATVHLTEQVQNEFIRNRESKIKDALKRLKDIRLAPQLPSFMKGYEEYEQILKLAKDLQDKHKSISEKADRDVATKNLVADRLIEQIFTVSKIVPVTKEVFEQASMRMALGNPPGKNRSLGDAVNWITLLKSVPDKEDLHLISEDGDFYSELDDTKPHPFLAGEWHHTKKGSLFVYRTLSVFMKEHFDGVAFSFDKNKDALIEELRTSPNFASTHYIIGKLADYTYFSAKEISRILEAAAKNDQVSMIIRDHDVSDFLNRVAVPHMSSITAENQKTLLQEVIDEQRDRPMLAL